MLDRVEPNRGKPFLREPFEEILRELFNIFTSIVVIDDENTCRVDSPDFITIDAVRDIENVHEARFALLRNRTSQWVKSEENAILTHRMDVIVIFAVDRHAHQIAPSRQTKRNIVDVVASWFLFCEGFK